MKKNKYLLIAFGLTLFLPYLGSYLKWGGMPPGYGLFPAQKVINVPDFNEYSFIFASCLAVLIVLFLSFPRLFGFKKSEASSEVPSHVPFPSWFFPALLITLVSWFLMWIPIPSFEFLSTFTFVPLWWGFIYVLDGIVYKRNNGISLVSSMPVTMKLLRITSSFSWFIFEFLNFFVLGNWYYPNNQILTNFGNVSWQLLSYTTVLPAIFEWYWLLRTFKGLNNYYKQGPRISPSKTTQFILLFLGLVLLFLMGYFPFELFWVLWVCLIPVLVPTMNLTGHWTPFTPIAQKGDWSYILLIAIATVLNGFFWELWNFGSEWFHDTHTNPNYWKYSVPYLDKYHLFSEMPILGYFGYLFFGIVCWILWLVVAYLFGFSPDIEPKKNSASL